MLSDIEVRRLRVRRFLRWWMGSATVLTLASLAGALNALATGRWVVTAACYAVALGGGTVMVLAWRSIRAEQRHDV
jgi:hypothetical protein